VRAPVPGPDKKTIHPYDPADASKPQAINVEDLCTFALARWATVPEARAALAGMQLAWPRETYKARATGHVPWAGPAPCHLALFHHRRGPGGASSSRSGTASPKSWTTGDGVFTHEPFLQEHWAYMDDWDARMRANPAGVYPSVAAVPVPELAEEQGGSVFAAGGGGHGSGSETMFLPLPGDYSGPSRYTRLAMVKKYATEKACWTNESVIAQGEKEELNPAYVVDGQPAANQALLAALQVTNTAYLPRGLSDHGSAGAPIIEWTPLSTLRDHKARHFYIRAANSPVFHRYDLGAIDFSKVGGGSGVSNSPLVTPGTPWFVEAAPATA
jgi:hypothetical protein